MSLISILQSFLHSISEAFLVQGYFFPVAVYQHLTQAFHRLQFIWNSESRDDKCLIFFLQPAHQGYVSSFQDERFCVNQGVYHISRFVQCSTLPSNYSCMEKTQFFPLIQWRICVGPLSQNCEGKYIVHNSRHIKRKVIPRMVGKSECKSTSSVLSPGESDKNINTWSNLKIYSPFFVCVRV